MIKCLALLNAMYGHKFSNFTWYIHHRGSDLWFGALYSLEKWLNVLRLGKIDELLCQLSELTLVSPIL